jgi:hypothetical protein
MERLTLQRSTIHGTVHGQRVMSTVRAAPAGLILPPGQYLLHSPVDNPVYGQVMAIEPLPASVLPPGDIYIKGMPGSGIVKTPSAPVAIKDAPATIKDTQMRAPAWLKINSPASKVDSPSIKFDSPSIKFDGPSMKWATGPGSADQPVVITSRPIAGNGFVVTSGLGDLFDAVRRAGGVILVAE